MKTFLRYLLAAPLLALCAVPALAGGNANFFLGSRGLDKDFWSPINSQAAFGASVDFGKKGWPIHLETGFYGSGGYKENYNGPLDITGSVGEIFFGVNKTWMTHGSARPFIGGGLASVSASYKFSAPGGDTEESDDSGGVYFHGGVFWRIGNRFNIGVDGRLLGGTHVTLFGNDGNADYGQLGLVLGWGWPGGGE